MAWHQNTQIQDSCLPRTPVISALDALRRQELLFGRLGTISNASAVQMHSKRLVVLFCFVFWDRVSFV